MKRKANKKGDLTLASDAGSWKKVKK